MIIILIGSAITILGGIITIYGTYKAGVESEKDTAEIKNNTKNTLENTNRQLIYTNGGEGYCRITFNQVGNTNGLLLMVANNSEITVYGLSIRIRDNECNELVIKNNPDLFKSGVNKPDEQLHAFDKCQLTADLPSLNPNTTTALGSLGLKLDNEFRSFNIQIILKNGSFRQYQYMYKLKNQWITATRVINEATNEVKYEIVDPRIPKRLINW